MAHCIANTVSGEVSIGQVEAGRPPRCRRAYGPIPHGIMGACNCKAFLGQPKSLRGDKHLYSSLTARCLPLYPMTNVCVLARRRDVLYSLLCHAAMLSSTENRGLCACSAVSTAGTRRGYSSRISSDADVRIQDHGFHGYCPLESG